MLVPVIMREFRRVIPAMLLGQIGMQIRNDLLVGCLVHCRL